MNTTKEQNMNRTIETEESGVGGADAQDPCSDRAIYCRKGLLHVHESPREALVDSYVDLNAWSQRIAGFCRSSRTNRWFGRYRDPVLHAFAEWAADRLAQLGKLLEALMDAALHQDAAALGRAEQDMKAVADDCLHEIARRAAAQHRQRSGHRKKKHVGDLYNAVHALFKDYAEPAEIAYLARWVCSGVRPGTATGDETVANHEEKELGNGNQD